MIYVQVHVIVPSGSQRYEPCQAGVWAHGRAKSAEDWGCQTRRGSIYALPHHAKCAKFVKKLRLTWNGRRLIFHHLRPDGSIPKAMAKISLFGDYPKADRSWSGSQEWSNRGVNR